MVRVGTLALSGPQTLGEHRSVPYSRSKVRIYHEGMKETDSLAEFCTV